MAWTFSLASRITASRAVSGSKYIEQRSRPAFSRLAGDDRGLPAVHDFFAALIEARCSGAYARWGWVSNAHAGGENSDTDIRAVVDRHHGSCGRRCARHSSPPRPRLSSNGTDPGAAADLLALLAHGVNPRSRAGADAGDLTRTVSGAFDALGAA
ncbi:hypothetical protein ABZY05_40415 [Streptomyces canus]|uniref:hypothetical protein n=1 Tax=Streptomyces canus TaxID=58343 RepID=UPI0033BF8D7F